MQVSISLSFSAAGESISANGATNGWQPCAVQTRTPVSLTSLIASSGDFSLPMGSQGFPYAGTWTSPAGSQSFSSGGLLVEGFDFPNGSFPENYMALNGVLPNGGGFLLECYVSGTTPQLVRLTSAGFSFAGPCMLNSSGTFGSLSLTVAFGPPSPCQVSPTVAPVSQSGTSWGGNAYDHAGSDGSGLITIARRGSALTSLSIALDSAGGNWNPGTLNSLLNTAGGYDSYASVQWATATLASNGKASTSGLQYSNLGGTVDSDVSLTGAIQAVESQICASTPHPIIVGVRSHPPNNSGAGKYPGHFVLITGELLNPDGSKVFNINDPSGYSTILGNSAYTNGAGQPEFQTRGFVSPSTDLRELTVSVNATADLIVVDPNNLQSGFQKGTPVQNILHSAATLDEIDDDVTGSAGTPMEGVTINSPASGTFQFSLTGVNAGPYSMTVTAGASNGLVESFSFSGSINPGTVVTYVVNYNPAFGSTRVSTVNGVTISPCDVNYDKATNVLDVQLIVNEALGLIPAANDLNHDGVVNIADVQIEINAALGLGCAAQ
jgi:hypothetical protein